MSRSISAMADAGERANYGASPGDATIPEPYLYIGPWEVDHARAGGDPFWNQPWGAALRYDELRPAPDPERAAAAFLADGHRRLTGRTGRTGRGDRAGWA